MDFAKVKLFGLGVAAGIIVTALSWGSIHLTSSTEFCISCHEMRVVAEQGWMKSKHYANPHGVVAECVDCHVPPEPVPLLWTKTRDGIKDVVVHLFGESDPYEMDWEHLGQSARSKIYDSACKRCHGNLVPAGASIKMIIAHREYERLKNKTCLQCHKEEIHGGFKEFLFGETISASSGESK